MLTATEASPSDLSLDPRLTAAIERMERDLGHSWRVVELARIASLSPSRFAHAFRDRLGETPRRYLERRRLEEAALRLRATALSAQRIAAEFGFADLAHFSRRFRLRYGAMPGRWRRQMS